MSPPLWAFEFPFAGELKLGFRFDPSHGYHALHRDPRVKALRHLASSLMLLDFCPLMLPSLDARKRPIQFRFPQLSLFLTLSTILGDCS